MSSSRQRSFNTAEVNEQDENQAQRLTMRTSSAFVFVPRQVQMRNGGNTHQVENVRPRPLPGTCEDDQRSFIQEFREHVVDLIREFRRDFRYRQQIEWTMEYGREKQHTLHVKVKQPRSMRREHEDD